VNDQDAELKEYVAHQYRCFGKWIRHRQSSILAALVVDEGRGEHYMLRAL